MSNITGENDYNHNHTKTTQTNQKGSNNVIGNELKEAIHHMVANISKSFIVEWYTSISPTNHDFVASCETLIEDILIKLAELSIKKLDKYKIGQLVTSLLHDHILNEKQAEKVRSVERQIDDYEYDICQSSVVRLFGLLSDDNLRRVVFTKLFVNSPDLNQQQSNYQYCSRGKNTQHYQHAYSSSSTTTSSSTSPTENEQTKTTSALYTLVIAMLTKAAFMPIVDSISDPNWLYAVIIWLCKKEEREIAKKKGSANGQNDSIRPSNNFQNPQFIDPRGGTINGMHPPTSIVVTNTRGYRSLDLEEGIDIVSSNINFENPICGSLKRPLDNIEIYSTEEVKSNNSCYILYCIRYDGLCFRHPSAGYNFLPDQPNVPIIDKRQTSSISRRSNIKESSCSNPINREVADRKSFRRSMTIKRRFREFVLLQLRLEENPKIRPYMKNIPKPTKLKAATQNIFSLPGITNIKLDQSTIKLRQRFLERFLIALNSSPFIANSYEFKEFFSYNINPINISKSKSTILQVNLNKVFVDSVRSAFSIIRSTLPGDDHQSLRSSSNPDPDAWLTELQQSTLKLHVQTRTSHSKMNLERMIDSKLLLLSESPTRGNKTCSLGRYYQRSGGFDWTGGSRGGSLRTHMVKSNSTGSNTNSSSMMSRSTSSNSRNVDISSRSSSTESVYHDASNVLDDDRNFNGCNTIQLCDSVPIASKLIDMVHYSINGDSACYRSPINFVARLLLGKTIERYALRLLETAFTLKNAAFCINGITSSIWDESDDPPLDLENASLDEAAVHLTMLVEQNYANHTLIPKNLLKTLIGKQIRFFLSQLSSQKRNKFVIYSFFVHLLDELEIVDQL